MPRTLVSAATPCVPSALVVACTTIDSGDAVNYDFEMPGLARTRKLGPAHFAFMRGLVQGLPLRETWERYLGAEGSATDLRVVRTTINWIRDAFAAAARRENRFGTARLVLFDVSRLPEAASKVPSLEEFAAARGIEDFSQAEQIEAFEAEYGKAGERQTRRARLIAKQLDALRWLESLVAQPPRAGDAVSAWLNPSIALRLEAAGIFTLAQLLDRINGVGRGWPTSIKGVGKAKAERVVHWLMQNQATIGIAVGRHVGLPRTSLYRHELQQVVRPATDIRPLEKLVVPAELDGSGGAFRRPQAHCLLSASNDYAALLAWLQSKAGVTPEQRDAAKARRRGRDAGIDGPMDWLHLPLAHPARLPQGGRAIPAVGRHREAQAAVVDDDRGLCRLPRLPRRPSASLALVRAAQPRAVVAAVAAL